MMEIFKAHIISFDKYEPSVFQNEDLVVRIGEGYFLSISLFPPNISLNFPF